MVYWLVQLVLLTMVAGSNVWWQGSKIKQYRQEGWPRYVNLWGSAHRSTISFNSSHKLINQTRSKLTCSIRH